MRFFSHLFNANRRGRDRMVVNLQLPMQSMSDVVSLNLDQGEVYKIMW
jgi:hypothetical protein